MRRETAVIHPGCCGERTYACLADEALRISHRSGAITVVDIVTDDGGAVGGLCRKH